MPVRPRNELGNAFAFVQRDVLVGKAAYLALAQPLALQRFLCIVREQPCALHLSRFRLWVAGILARPALVGLGWARFVTGMFHP